MVLVAVSGFVFFETARRFRDPPNLIGGMMMAVAPDALDTGAVRAALSEVDGVAGIHDLHVWTLTSGIVMLTAHATLKRSSDAQRTLRGIS
jgi:Co/Zn/Cd efflux system component